MKYYLLIIAATAVCFSQVGIGQDDRGAANRKNSFGDGEFLEYEPAPEAGINIGVNTGIDVSTETASDDTLDTEDLSPEIEPEPRDVVDGESVEGDDVSPESEFLTDEDPDGYENSGLEEGAPGYEDIEMDEFNSEEAEEIYDEFTESNVEPEDAFLEDETDSSVETPDDSSDAYSDDIEANELDEFFDD